MSSGYQGYQGYPALQGTLIQVVPHNKLFFSPLVLKLKLDWGIISVKDARVFFLTPGSLHLQGPCPHCPKPMSWAMLLKDLFKLTNTLYCKRNHSAGLPRKADAGHLALPSFSTATTCCISANRHLCEAAAGEWGCNWNTFEARFAVCCSSPAIHHTTVICFQLSLVSFLQQQQKTREIVRFGKQFTYKNM